MEYLKKFKSTVVTVLVLLLLLGGLYISQNKESATIEENPTKVSLKKGVRLYQSTQLYNQQLSVEDLIPMLTSSDLTLRVSALRKGVDSHSTCMELKTGILADLMEESSDFKGDKVTKLVLPNEEHGAIYVALQESRGKHYIQKVDYEVMSETDNKMHV